MKSNLKHYLVLLLFILTLLTPAIDRKLHLLPVMKSTEKRDLAPRPQYSLSVGVPTMIKSFEAYWNDNFGGRSLLINLRTRLWVKLFGESPIPYVTIGKNGWLFYKSEAKNDGPGINDYQGLTPLTDDEIKGIVESVVQVKDELAKKDITLIVTVAPNKSSVYADQLPSYIHKLKSQSRLDQIKSAMPKDINFVDLRPVLIDGRSSLNTYQTTDSHWNNYGAFLSVTELLKSIPKEFKISPYSLDDYNVESQPIMGEGDLASMMAARGIFKELSVTLTSKKDKAIVPEKFATDQDKYTVSIYKGANAKLPRLVVFGDSFAGYMGMFLAPHFSTSYVISFANNYKLNDDLIDQESPDIIIWEVAERYVDRLKQ